MTRPRGDDLLPYVTPSGSVNSRIVPDEVKELWEQLHDVTSNEQAWGIIMRWRDAVIGVREL